MSKIDKLLASAEASFQVGNYEAAIEHAKAILEHDPKELSALSLLGRVHCAKQEISAVDRIADDMLAIAPDHAEGHRLKAVVFSGQKKNRRAVAKAREAVELDPSEPANHLILGCVLEDSREFEECESAYRKAIELDPELIYQKTGYADFLLKRGRSDEARALLQEVSDKNPGDNDVIILRGKLALRDNNLTEALENALWALRDDATDPEAIDLLAQVKIRKNPIMGLWWRWAVWIEKFAMWQRWAIILGLVFFVRLVPLLWPFWIGFCVLTWIGPSIHRRMIKRELRAVTVKPF